MGTTEASPVTSLDALFPKVRQRLLATLFGQPERTFYVNELMRLADSGTGAVLRELASLAAAELVTVNRRGNQKHYQANAKSPLFPELRAIVAKTSGISERLRLALEPLSQRIAWAMMYGSTAKGTLHGSSDVDLMIIADDLTLETIYKSLATAEEEIGRKINPTVYTREEFRRRKATHSTFLTKVLAGKHMTLLGSENAVG